MFQTLVLCCIDISTSTVIIWDFLKDLPACIISTLKYITFLLVSIINLGCYEMKTFTVKCKSSAGFSIVFCSKGKLCELTFPLIYHLFEDWFLCMCKVEGQSSVGTQAADMWSLLQWRRTMPVVSTQLESVENIKSVRLC